MFFVPVVPPHPHPPSPCTRELADLLGRVIEEYEKHHPAVTGPEVRAALKIAGGSSKTATRATALVAGFVALLLAGGFVFLAVNGGEAPVGGIPGAAAGIVVLVAFGVAVLLRRLAGK